MDRHRSLAAALAAGILALATACGGSASANGGSGSVGVSPGSGTTTATGSAARHSFSAQIASLAGIVDRLGRLSGSAGSGRVAGAIGDMRAGVARARGELAATDFPSPTQSQKQRLIAFLGRWDGDLGHAQTSARNGDTATAIHEARSSTYRDLRALLDTLSAASIG